MLVRCCRSGCDHCQRRHWQALLMPAFGEDYRKAVMSYYPRRVLSLGNNATDDRLTYRYKLRSVRKGTVRLTYEDISVGREGRASRTIVNNQWMLFTSPASKLGLESTVKHSYRRAKGKFL